MWAGLIWDYKIGSSSQIPNLEPLDYGRSSQNVHILQANTIWALATLSFQPSLEHLQALAEHSRRTLEIFSPQNIANTLWAFAILGYRHPVSLPLFHVINLNKFQSPFPEAFLELNL